MSQHRAMACNSLGLNTIPQVLRASLLSGSLIDGHNKGYWSSDLKVRIHLWILQRYSNATFDLTTRTVSFQTWLLCPIHANRCNDKKHFFKSLSFSPLSSCVEGLNSRSVSQQKGYFDNREAWCYLESSQAGSPLLESVLVTAFSRAATAICTGRAAGETWVRVRAWAGIFPSLAEAGDWN